MGAYTTGAGSGMYPQMVYHADVRAREMELELAAERQAGCSCSPLSRMISRVIRKCNGREGRVSRYDEKMDYAMAYAPAQTCYVRPTARNVTLAQDDHYPTHAHAVQPEPPRAHATALPVGTAPFPSTGAPPQGGARKPKKKKKKKQVRFTPSAGPVPVDAPPPHAQHHTATPAGGGGAAGTATGVVYHHGAAEPPPSHSPAPPVQGRHSGHGCAYAYGYGRYAPSPLPRWEMLGTPRRPEYFSSEYRWYYPTPVREGIYSIATDANGRLSTIFSEENPNACTIV